MWNIIIFGLTGINFILSTSFSYVKLYSDEPETTMKVLEFKQGDEAGVGIYYTNTHTTVELRNRMPGEAGITLQTDFTLDTWMFLAVTYDYDTRTASLYVNGMLADTNIFDAVITLATAGPIVMEDSEACISCVQVYSQALTAEEIETRSACTYPTLSTPEATGKMGIHLCNKMEVLD